MTMLLELKNVTKSFELPNGENELVVLKTTSLQIDHGETTAIVGPSGSGKSTLLNIIGSLDKPTSGEVLFEGQDLSQLGDDDLAVIRNQRIGFVFQLHHLLPQCTVLENVLLPTIPRAAAKDKAGVIRRAESLLEKVGLKDRLDFFPALLSGGELQRVAVVRALINRPKLVLADEPTGSLDKSSSEALGRLLVDLNREEGISLVTVTHSMALAQLMNRVFSLQDGQLILE
jgi:lipoprotein-releasing system ATP-binding protein